MVQKYETKRWYVAPTEATKEEAKWNNEAALNNKAQARPVRSSLLGESAPKPAAGPGQVSVTVTVNGSYCYVLVVSFGDKSEVVSVFG